MIELVDSGFFVMRSPLLAFDELERFGEGLEAAASLDDPERLEHALAADVARLRERLRQQVARPEVRDALFVASPDLESALEAWERDPDSPRGQGVERALVRYLQRMAARATPFGLFAGCSVGGIADSTRLLLEPAERNGRHSRLDQDYLDALLSALEQDPALRAELSFRPNSSLYRAAGQLRFVETHLDGRKRSHHLTAVAESEHLRIALERARDGATRAELAAAVAGHDVSTEHAEDYVDELIDSQVVVPELAIPVTGPEPLDLLAEELSAHRASADVGRRLMDARDELNRIDTAGVGAEPSRYRAVAEGLSDLPAEVSLGRLFQVDMHKPTPRATLGNAVLAELVRGVELLHRIAPGLPSSELQTFRERFADRFEQREVPLVEALDDDAGVGFPVPDRVGASPLLQGIALPFGDDEEVPWGKRQRLLLRKLVEAAAAGAESISLDGEDLDVLAVDEPPPLPDALAVQAVLAAASEEALDAGEFRLLLKGSVGPSGARLLGRFAHGDAELRRAIERHLRAEEALRPDAVFAEIVHLSEGRIGNISSRPLLRAYEIPYLGRSGTPRERQIPVDDLMVSVTGDRTVSPLGESIVLRSRRLGRPVIPRLTTAHNFGYRSVPLYRFLCLLQGQDRQGDSWSWGPLVAAPFLPRVEAGRLVLSPARWVLAEDEVRELQQADRSARFLAAQELRERRRLPRHVALQDYDNVLPVDFDNALSVDALISVLKGRDAATLVERWPDPGMLCARGPEGRFVHELVVPLVRTQPVRAAVAPREAPLVVWERTRPPGSDWLYAKLYAGTAAADRILPEVVAPLVDEIIQSGAADSWFFIRYADPNEHLRLRFHGAPAALREDVQPRVEAALGSLLDEGRAWRLCFDTYEREVERYGGPEGIEIAERIFRVDSDTVLELLTMFEPGERGAEERWKMALSGASVLMADLGLGEPERINLLRGLRDSFGHELKIDADGSHKLRERLREHRRSLEPLVEPGDDVPDDLGPGIEVLRARSARLRPLIAELHALDESGRLTTTRASLASSFVHMYVNRLLRTAPRIHELVIYDFLLRLYESRAARARDASRAQR